MGSLAGARGLSVVGRRGGKVAVVAAGMLRAWGRAAVAVVVALAAARVSVPAARALNPNTEIAFQANTGDLWLRIPPGTAKDLGLGMRAGTSPSISLDPGPAPLGGARLATWKIGGPGNDRLIGSSGNDLIVGGPGNDLIRGRRGNDTLYGGPGNDRIYGGPGNDVLDGGPGNDRITPGLGRDHVSAGAGNDRIFARDGQRDVIDCGPGHDVAIVDRGDVTRRCEVVIRARRRLQPPRTGLG